MRQMSFQKIPFHRQAPASLRQSCKKYLRRVAAPRSYGAIAKGMTLILALPAMLCRDGLGICLSKGRLYSSFQSMMCSTSYEGLGSSLLKGAMSVRRKGSLVAAVAHALCGEEKPYGKGLSPEGEYRVPLEQYRAWIAAHDSPASEDFLTAQEEIGAWDFRPLISVLMPVYNTEEHILRETLESVLAQWYPDWELCIADDASTKAHIREILTEYMNKDARIRVVFREENGHICAASNTALTLVSGEFTALLDHDDVLPAHALYRVACAIREHPDAHVLYSDEDKLSETGERYDPYFKPDWDEDLLCALNYVSHLGVYRTSLLHRIGGFRLGTEGSQDYDLLLRCVAHATSDQIYHIPQILYHWRQFSSSGSYTDGALEECEVVRLRAVSEYVSSKNTDIRVTGSSGLAQIHYPLPSPVPRVSCVLFPHDDATAVRLSLSGILEQTDYPALEVILPESSSTIDSRHFYGKYASHASVRLLDATSSETYASFINTAAEQASGEYLFLCGGHITVLHADWLLRMMEYAVRPQTGAVGARLLHGNGTVYHAGLALGYGGVAGAPWSGLEKNAPGYRGGLQVAHRVSAVTGDCMLLPQKIFVSVGGMTSDLKGKYHDVDLCLKLSEKGYRHYYVPFATLSSTEEACFGRDFPEDVRYMCKRWGDVLPNDPYFSKSLQHILGVRIQ